MRKDETIRIDCHALARRIDELGLKSSWLAGRLGVAPKTVGRWRSGRVPRMARENADGLARLLGCSVADFATRDEVDVHATRVEQREAARLLQERDLLALLSPSDDFALAERLIRATLEPHLARADLGRLYNLLSIATWRQGRYDEAGRHADRALEIGRTLGDRAIEWRARSSRAIIASLVGSPTEAAEEYERCLAQPENFESPRELAGALTNLAMIHREAARFEEARRRQQASIGIFERLDLPFNLAIARIGMGTIRLEVGEADEARRELELASADAGRARWAKGRATARVHLADAISLAGDAPGAVALLEEALPELARYEVTDLGCQEAAVRVLRRAGALAAAGERYEAALPLGRPFPIAHALLLFEGARLAIATGRSAAEVRRRREASAIFRRLGLPLRVRDEPVAEYGAMFRSDPPTAARRRGAPRSRGTGPGASPRSPRP